MTGSASLISKIDDALERIADGSYGYCEETGEPISLRRLEARPIATLSIEAQEALSVVKSVPRRLISRNGGPAERGGPEQLRGLPGMGRPFSYVAVSCNLVAMTEMVWT